MSEDLHRRGIGMTSQRTRERLIQRLYEEGLSNAHVLEVIRCTPRHLFVDEALSHRAYEDTALPIGHNQTISQPFMVARMTELLLAAGPLDKVMEIGTGSGYQTAVLAQLVERVFSVERIQALQDKAKERLAELNLRNVVFRWGDGWEGWSALAPYNGIIVTAAATEVPQSLLDQLAPGAPGDPGRWRRGPATDADRPHRGRVQPPGTRLGTFRPAAQRPDRLSRRPASPARLNESEEDG